MKRITILTLALTVLIGGTYAKKKVKKEILSVVPTVLLTNEVDSMSYALGVSMGADFANNLKNIPGGKSNRELIIKGFSEAFRGDSTLLKTDSAQIYFRNFLAKAQAKEMELKKAEGERFLAENKLKDSVQITESGLQYKVIKMGTGNKPIETDKVKVHYTGMLMDGTVFDSSVQRGEPVEFQLNQVITGWSEGVQLMNVGSKYRFYIPYNLGYGERGMPQAGIQPYAPLIFDVELLDIIKEEPAPKVEEVKDTKPVLNKKVSNKKK